MIATTTFCRSLVVFGPQSAHCLFPAVALLDTQLIITIVALCLSVITVDHSALPSSPVER